MLAAVLCVEVGRSGGVELSKHRVLAACFLWEPQRSWNIYLYHMIHLICDCTATARSHDHLLRRNSYKNYYDNEMHVQCDRYC